MTGRTFFHIRDYQQRGRRPEPGELVKYVADNQGDGRWKATQVMPAARPVDKSPRARRVATPDNPYSASRGLAGIALVLGYACLLAWAIRHQVIAFEFAFAPALMSIAAFLAYAADKHAAQTGRWRIPEANLHVLELLGGWPGALFSQRVLRHKTCKAGYRVVFRMMLGMNLAATGAWIYWKS